MKIQSIGLAILVLSSCTASHRAIRCAAPANANRFEARNGQFLLDGRPFQIIAGEMHPARIPYQFWEDRIKKAKAMGLNTVSLYVFWNQVEPAEGQFDFQGNSNIRRFVQLCGENGLWVIMRPGPYACAETEFGGYPAWLLKHHQLKLRSDDPAFLEYNRRYLKALNDQVGDLQITHGGPIIMVQVENELGRIDKYLADLKQIFIESGFDTQLFTCDHSGSVWNQIQGLPSVLRATNGLPNAQKLNLAEKVAGNYPVYGSEVYTSWFSIWGGRVGGPASKAKSVATQIKDTQWLLDRNLSFCYYVFDGGTNFGFSNGASGWQPVQTTYDYDAPIDELGRVTPKYRALRDLFARTFKLELPPIPADPSVIEIPAFPVAPQRPLLALLGRKPVQSNDVMTMEDLNQSYGFIVYRKKFDSLSGELDLKKALDYSFVMIDGKVVGEAFAGLGAGSFKMKLSHAGLCTLDILVYNLGRNSVGINPSSSRKGLNENPTLDGHPIDGWAIYSLPMDDPDAAGSSSAPAMAPASTPMFYSGEFALHRTGETYLDMRQWKFGVVWVNGHNLGRFWDVGGGRSLYLPSVWQKVGRNQIRILELGGAPAVATLSGVSHSIETKPVNFHAYFAN